MNKNDKQGNQQTVCQFFYHAEFNLFPSELLV